MKKHPILIDCDYLHSQYAGAYLITEGSRALFVENNTSHAVPILLEELKKQGFKPDQVDYLIITHVHLDHAGGTSALVRACPQATVLAHPKAARHLIDPSKLIQSARAVYGNETFERLYGQIEPIAAERVRVMQDGEELTFGTRVLRFFYTRGHANHHICVYDSGSEGTFTGDSFGLAYPALQRNGPFIFPSTSPTDFDAAEARLSIQRILDSGAKQLYLTHFGEIAQLRPAANQLLQHLDFHEQLLNRAIHSDRSNDNLEPLCRVALQDYFKSILETLGMSSDSLAWNILTLDIELNAAGIAYAARKKRETNQTSPKDSKPPNT